MPVILTTDDEVEQWLTAPAAEALQLQRPLPDDVLRLVAREREEKRAGCRFSRRRCANSNMTIRILLEVQAPI